MILDDQLMKVGAMNASPFVKPFKKESHEWEAMLRLLQVCVCLCCFAGEECVFCVVADLVLMTG